MRAACGEHAQHIRRIDEAAVVLLKVDKLAQVVIREDLSQFGSRRGVHFQIAFH